MTRTSRARRIAAAAAYGGGGLGVIGALAAGFYGLLLGESKLARRRIPQATGGPPASDGTIWTAGGVSSARPPIRLAMMGDSTAAGYGVHRERDTPGARVAIGISTVARRPVLLVSVAIVGAESITLTGQTAQLPTELDIVVIIVGANDVTHRIKPETSVRALASTVAELTSRGVPVVVGTCPDLGTIKPVAQPLRYVARRLSRRLAAAQTIATVRSGGRSVSLGDLLGPLFSKRRDMFSEDRFHPSAAGYAAAADALLPTCLDALGLRTRESALTTLTAGRARSLPRAAVKAAARPGTEVAATTVHGQSEGPHGQPWARIRRRRPAVQMTSVAEQAQPQH